MKPDGAIRLHVEPVGKTVADEFVDCLHRHHEPTPWLGLFSIACVDSDGLIRGVATTAIPSGANRLKDGFRCMEVVRVATDGTSNACSVLYGACARAARALGYTRIITYTLTSEPGTSLRGAGWNEDEGTFGNKSWEHHGGRPGVVVSKKRRWSMTLCDENRPAQTLPEMIIDARDQLKLFAL